MTLLSIALLLIGFLALRRLRTRLGRAELTRQIDQIAVAQWDPAPDVTPDADAPAADEPAATPPARASLAFFHRAVHGPGLCSPQTAKTTTR